MFKLLKRYVSAFFTLGKGEQRAIIILLIMVLAISVFNLLLPRLITHKSYDQQRFIHEVNEFRRKQQAISDSMEMENLQSNGKLNFAQAQQKLKPFKFDPNYLPVEKWKKLGLTDKQISVIKNYENKGGSFTKKEDLKRMYCISDAEYQVLEPYITIKAIQKTTIKKQAEKIEEIAIPEKEKLVYKVVELNSAHSEELTENLHLPEWLAQRIVKYRDLLGGFARTSQLGEVYGFDINRIGKLNDYITIDVSQIKQLDLNNATFEEILHHPYISYDITKRIVNYQEKHGELKSIEELVDNHLISDSLFVKLKPYITVNPSADKFE